MDEGGELHIAQQVEGVVRRRAVGSETEPDSSSTIAGIGAMPDASLRLLAGLWETPTSNSASSSMSSGDT